jgi:glucose-1-phosphate cytidylyltransferase
MLYEYDGFWHCLDTFKDKLDLEKMWKHGPKWKTWKD